MSLDPVLSAVLLGFLLGLQHATDADHLVAVATIVSRERRFRDGAVVGALWGAGHMTTLAIVGGVIIVFDLTVAPAVGTGLELAVAALLIVLGVLRLRDALRGWDATAPGDLVADHEHNGPPVLHRHPRVHVHPSRRLVAALTGDRQHLRAVAVGMMHGLAGSAAAALVVLATIRTSAGAVAYLLVFGLGTIAGMTVLTAAMAYPLASALRFRRVHRWLAAGTGACAIAFGVFYAAHAF
ncbi:MAG: high-affinity nickel-transport family protein [Candidatus Rokuibacteriota bacterium]